jgi:hypothetical protein
VSQDPRLSDLLQYATSVLGVGPADPTVALAQRVENLERVLAAVLRTPNIQEVAGTPTVAARNGTPAVDTSAPRLWIRRNGAWQFATLT